ncbi:MAG TPA: SufD family Fe-S cluster assembly protein [Termitinemataceae bacterium]|nr:SufD family Fe-S cluster assembly protein [Termitinemataceae bacterium]HOM22296.1 SufD family Fe-S cluster assembly protein [Termitinemataceae bacterium]HPP99282.1 SufD family Fe-S cluster assembly protein [Termitinemataceae bacterium]
MNTPAIPQQRTVSVENPVQGDVIHVQAYQEQEILLPPQEGVVPSHREIHLHKGARLRVLSLGIPPQNILSVPEAPASEAHPHIFHHFVLEEDSQLLLTEVVFHSSSSQHHTVIELQGPGSKVDVLGIYGGWGVAEQHHSYIVHHHAPHTTSTSHFRSVVTGTAHLVFQDRIHIARGAPKSDGILSIRNLILNDGAHAEAYPELEIENNDVSCSHGATTGGIDPHQAYYLQSRGISPEESRALLVLAHIATAFPRLPEVYQEQVRRLVLEQLAYAKEGGAIQ